MVIRVLVADDHTIVAEGLEALLKDTFELVGVARDGRELLAMADKFRPDVVVTDVSMPALNGLDAIRQIRSVQSRVKFVVLTMHADSELAVQAFRSGASAYLLKVSPGEELITAIQEVHLGRFYLSSLIARDLLSILLEARGDDSDRETKLTARQRDVLQLIAEGRTMKEIATTLGISQRTAESHKYDMMQALGVKTTAALIQYAIKIKLVAG
jgi:DNA-binding NarL/FixJ family response regulator